MSRVFFTSDLHFGHENLCRAIRGMSAKESEELIIENWNKVITKRDLVYILGDFTFEKASRIPYLCNALRGDKYIIGGNHDTLGCVKEFMRLGIPVLGCAKYRGFLCSHTPIHTSEVGYFRGNIHGHIHHTKYNGGLGPEYYNVNTELHDYTPVLFDEIEQYFINLKS